MVAAENEIVNVLEGFQGFMEKLGIHEPLSVSVVRLALILLVGMIFAKLLGLVLSKPIAGLIGALIAILGVAFIPSAILSGIITTYNVAFSVILLIIPIALLIFLVYYVIPGNSLGWHIVRIIILLFALTLEVAARSWLI